MAWSFIETLKAPVSVKTWPVPVTPLAFAEIIVNGIDGVALGVVAVPLPPQAVTPRKRAAANKALCSTPH